MDTKGIYRYLALGVIVIGTFMAILDSSIVNIAIPKMMSIFGVSTDQIEWVLTGYMLTMGVVMPLTGFLGERFGLKKVYIFSLTVFTLGSLFCGFSWSLPSLIVARVIQAIGGGMIMPVSMTIIYRIVPRHKIGMAMGLWGIAAMAAPAIGPTLGGYLIEYMDWRLIFNINIPIGIMAVALSVVLLDDFKGSQQTKVDFGGILAIGIGLLTLLLALNEGNTEGWTSPYILTLGATSFVSILAFIIIELNHPDPVLDLRTFKNFPFALSQLISAITSIAMFGGVFLIPIYLQNIRGLSALQSGILMFPSSIGTAAAMLVSGKLYDKYGARVMALLGLMIMTLTTYELSKINLNTDYQVIMYLLVFRGVGMGLSMMPIQTYAMSTIANHRIGKASALSSTFRQVSGSFGVALLSSLMTHQQTVHSFRLTESLKLTSPAGQKVISGLSELALKHGVSGSAAESFAMKSVYSNLVMQSFTTAINDTFLFTVLISALGVLLTLFITGNKPAKDKNKHNTEAIAEI